MRRSLGGTIGLVWVGGAVLALIVYSVGPGRFVERVLAGLYGFRRAIDRFAETLALQGFDAIRALAFALFAVFLALCLIAMRRGLRARGALVVVSALFAILLYGPLVDGSPAAPDRWLAAFVLAAVGAAVMTRRLAGGARL